MLALPRHVEPPGGKCWGVQQFFYNLHKKMNRHGVAPSHFYRTMLKIKLKIRE